VHIILLFKDGPSDFQSKGLIFPGVAGVIVYVQILIELEVGQVFEVGDW